LTRTKRPYPEIVGADRMWAGIEAVIRRDSGGWSQ
jgi:hypothetical protein